MMPTMFPSADEQAAAYGTEYLRALEEGLQASVASPELIYRRFDDSELRRVYESLKVFRDTYRLPPKGDDEHRPHLGFLQYPVLFRSSIAFPRGAKDEVVDAFMHRHMAERHLRDPHEVLRQLTKKSILIGHRVAFYEPVFFALEDSLFGDKTSQELTEWLKRVSKSPYFHPGPEMDPNRFFQSTAAQGRRYFPAALTTIAEFATLIRRGILVPEIHRFLPRETQEAIAIDSMKAVADAEEMSVPTEYSAYRILLAQWQRTPRRYDMALGSPQSFDDFFRSCQAMAINLGGYERQDLRTVTWTLSSKTINAPSISLDDIIAIRLHEEVFDDYRRWISSTLQAFHDQSEFQVEEFHRFARDQLKAWDGKLKKALESPSLSDRLRLKKIPIIMGGIIGSAVAWLSGDHLLGIAAAGGGELASEIVGAASGESESVPSSTRRATAIHISAFTRR